MDDESDQYWCGYYYINHSTRRIFWLEKTNIGEFFKTKTEASKARIGEFQFSLLLLCTRLNMGYVEIQMEYQYW